MSQAPDRKGCIIGIDPGLSGAIAVYDPYLKELAAISRIPITTDIKNRKTNREIDAKALFKLLEKQIRDYAVQAIIIEDVHASPQMGVSSAFKFGKGFGIIEAIAEGSEVTKIEYVSPARWKARLNVPSDKSRSIARAIEIFGKVPQLAGNHVKDGEAEAAMIAYFGAMDIVQIETADEDPLS